MTHPNKENSRGGVKCNESYGMDRLKDGTVTFLLFLLFVEWLRPLTVMSELTSLYMLRPFIIAVGCFLLIDYVRCPAFVGWLFKLALCVYVPGYLFGHDRIVSWPLSYVQLFVADIGAIMDGQGSAVSGESRTVLFLFGWALAVATVRSIVMEKRQGLWFAISTILYLYTLQWWPGIDTSDGIVRATVWGFMLAAAVYLSRIERAFTTVRSGTAAIPTIVSHLRDDGVPPSVHAVQPHADRIGNRAGRRAGVAGTKISAVWLLCSLLTVGGAAAAAMSVSYSEPRGIDASSFSWGGIMEALASWVPSGTATVGYGEDDSRLGGSIKQDNTIVFTARTDVPTYWRGDSKSYYDGKGWSQRSHDVITANGYEQLPFMPANNSVSVSVSDLTAANSAKSSNSSNSTNSANRTNRTNSANSANSEIRLHGVDFTEQTQDEPSRARTTIIKQQVQMVTGNSSYPFFAGGSIVRFEGQAQADTGMQVRIDLATGQYRPVPPITSALYKMQVTHTVVDPDSLRSERAARPDELPSDSLQLPDALPARIRDLAVSVTAGADNPYDKVKAIEQYLQSHYEYRLTQLDKPKSGEDFVDQFLFEQRAGYCDYFSTAMIVMLRSIGVPARWVKGFAPGEVSRSDRMTMVVRSRHAHSWVEVFFPESGWVSFDPTPGGGAGTLAAPDGSAAGSGAAGADASGAGAEPPAPGTAQPQRGLAAANWTKPADWPVWGLLRRAAEGLPGRERLRGAVAGVTEAAAQAYAAAGAAARSAAGAAAMRTAAVAAALALAAAALPALRRAARAYAAARAGGPNRPERINRLFNAYWRKIFRQYGPKEDHETFREYAAARRFASEQQLRALAEFVRLYESARYGTGRSEGLSAQAIKRLWEDIKAPPSTDFARKRHKSAKTRS